MKINFNKKINFQLRMVFFQPYLIQMIVFLFLFFNQNIYASCGGTIRTWAGIGNPPANARRWSDDGNWIGNRPNNNTEDALIVASDRPTDMNETNSIGCLEIQSGQLKTMDGGAITLTIEGDYFRNLSTNGILIRANETNHWFVMGGSTAQTFENVDSIPNLRISNNSTVTLTQPFTITNTFDITATTSTIYINEDLTLENGANLFTIPSGVTVEVGAGATLRALGGITVAGTLIIQAGASLIIGSNKTLTVSSGALLKFNGASGNTASMDGDSGNYYNVAIAGNLWANYFRIDRMGNDSKGLDITGTIQQMDNGEFHYIPNGGFAMTFGGVSTIPSTIDAVSFFTDIPSGTGQSIDASGYNLSSVNFTNWSGLGCTSNTQCGNESDTNVKIDWGSEAGTVLAVSTNNNSGSPGDPVTAGAASEEFAIFAFALNKAATTTNVTSVTFTLAGTGIASDVDYIQVFNQGASCQTQGTQIGSNLIMSGSPATATISIPTGDVQTSGTTADCIHVYLKTTSSAENSKTLGLEINGTGDVTNSQGYSFSPTSGPPIGGPIVTISGDPTVLWKGKNSTNWNINANWQNGNSPNNSVNCRIGSGTNTLTMNGIDRSCQNVHLQNAGEIDWANNSSSLFVYGALTGDADYTFTSATAGPAAIGIVGSANQTITLLKSFPGNLDINNSGPATVSTSDDVLVGGNLTITAGIFQITPGTTVSITGNVTVLSGATLDIEPGGILKLGPGSILNIQNGATLEMIGTSGNLAQIDSTGTGNAYTVTMNGTIKAQYYSFSHLGAAGVNINTTASGATIDTTYHLQNGSFSYPEANSTTFLTLQQSVPTNTLDDMAFSLGGSSACSPVTNCKNISTSGVSSSGTLALDNYTGDLSGITYHTEGSTYLISWLGATNTIDLTQEASGPSSVNAGSTYVMGRFGFQQSLAGASYVDTDITSVKLTLLGTGAGNDIDLVKLYYDSNCDSSGGTLIDSGTYSGNPASITFSLTAGEATVETDTSSPPLRCLYVEYDVAAGASGGNTLGVKIAASTDVVTDQGYEIASGTPPPVNLGTAATIVASTATSWLGGTSTDWFNSANWTAGVPTATKNCTINNASNNPTIGSGGVCGSSPCTAICDNMTIGNGTLTLNAADNLELYGSFTNTGTFTQSGTFYIRDNGSTATDQSINSSTTLSALTFNKTAGGTGSLSITNSVTITTLTIPAGSDFEFQVPSGKTLTLGGSFTLSAGKFSIAGGGVLKMPNSSTFTVNSGGTLEMIGSSGNNAMMTCTSACANGFDVLINTGEIQAQYYTFDHLNTSGVTINSGATINTTYHLQDGTFSYPVQNSSTLLTLNKQVPANTMHNAQFLQDGSTACSPLSNCTNINSSGTGPSGTLTINNYGGDLGGPTYDTGGSYAISWTGAQNTILIAKDGTTPPTNVTAGTTANNMGRFYFKQALAGASYVDADITSIKLKLLGTNANSDIGQVRIYYDGIGAACNSSGGTLIGSGTFTGTPGTKTFTLNAADATIPMNATTTEKMCIYVEYDIASGAVNANTVGVEISADSYFTNDQGYEIDSSTSTPINLGTASNIINSATLTTWEGDDATNPTDWFTAANWSSGVPTNTVNCTIPNVTNAPSIDKGGSGCGSPPCTAVCATLNNSGETITFVNTTTSTLEVYGDFTNTGTFTINDGTINIADGGSSAGHSISSTSILTSLNFNKTGGGVVQISSTVMQINTLTMANTTSNMEFIIPDGKTLKIMNNLTVNEATLTIAPGGTLKMGDGTTLTIANNGAKLKMVGTSDNYSIMNSTGTTHDYSVVVNGAIEARYYTFDHLNATGVSLESTTAVDTTNHLQNGQFIYPVNSSTTFLTVKTTDADIASMNNCHFDLNSSNCGGTCSGTKNIHNTTANNITLDSFTGDRAGEAYETEDTADSIDWTGAMNTIDIIQGATGPTSVDAGSTYNMGRFRFTQTQAGSYADTDITILKLTLLGTATSSDIDAVRIYYDDNCDSSGGALIGTNTFSGSPLKASFTIAANDATIEYHASSPPNRCIYVEYDIAAGATNAATVGIKLNADADFANDQSYAVAGGTPLPVDLGSLASIVGATTTTWTGSTDTNWFDGSNWSNGIPGSSKSCNFSDAANDPVIEPKGGTTCTSAPCTAACKNLVSGNGVLTFTNTQNNILEVYGNYSYTGGTLTQNDGTIKLVDSTGSTQTFDSAQSISLLTFNKTGGGIVRFTNSLTITTLTLAGPATPFELTIPNGVTLSLTNGVTIPTETFTVQSGGVLSLASGQTIALTGGTFKTTGVANADSNSVTSNKAKVTATSGTWGFNATSGTVSLQGFFFDYLDNNGVRINGSSVLSELKGGLFRHLSTTSGMRVINLNTTSNLTLPGDAQWLTFSWENDGTPGTPAPPATYWLVYGADCGTGNPDNITLVDWGGEWHDGTTPTAESKTNDFDDGGGNQCQVNWTANASAISLLSFSATPYNAAVDIKWVTNIETDHLGFNIYRSNAEGSEFIQINDSLLRNINTSNARSGKYRFIDQDVTNGSRYYYYIEDIEIDNVTWQMHGPVSAIPLEGLETPPANEIDENVATNPDSDSSSISDPAIIDNPSFKDLGHGVLILSQTSSSLRLQITPKAPTFHTSTWNGSYEEVEIDGHTKTLDVGKPEILERTILIEVHDYKTTASITNSSVIESTLAGHLLAPAPNWSDNGGGTLVANWSPDAAVYTANTFAPASFFSILTDLKTIGNNKYLEVKINPLLYNPVTQNVRAASKIILDIGFDGEAWEITAPDPALDFHPSIIGNTLRIHYNKSGIHELTYDDMYDSSVEGPFDGVDTNNFRLYHNGVEIPLEINSSGNFISGDSLRFYVPYSDSLEDIMEELILASIDIKGNGEIPLRIETLDGNPAGKINSSNNGTFINLKSETNDLYNWEDPVGDGLDHFFWKVMKAPYQNDPRCAYFDTPDCEYTNVIVNTPTLIATSDRPLTIKLTVLGTTLKGEGMLHFQEEVTHTISVFINSSVAPFANIAFTGTDLKTLSISMPANFSNFIAGTNTIRIKTDSTYVPAGGTYDQIYLDKVEVIYFADADSNSSGQIELIQQESDTIQSIIGLASNQISVYDITQSNRYKKLSNLSINNSGPYNLNFFANSDNGDLGEHYLIVEDSAILKPINLSLTLGHDNPLKNSDRKADLLVIGHKVLVDAAFNLISARKEQGLIVASITLDQIYAEFSNGKRSSAAIREFIRYTQTNWSTPAPRFVLFLGDATYDPKNHNVDYESETVSLEKATMPIPLIPGRYINYASDNWFATSNNSNHMPTISIGRLPTNDPAILEAYINKMLDYESGILIPTLGIKKMTFIVDSDTAYDEGFRSHSDDLINIDSLELGGFTSTTIDRTEHANNAETRTAIIDAFNDSTFLINYIGHGASNIWAHTSIFGNTQANNLTNSKLPITVALNCENNMFYLPGSDPMWLTLGEQLIFNEKGGAIVFLGSTTMTTPPAQIKVATAFYNELGNIAKLPYHDVRIGEIFLRAKIASGENIYVKDMVQSFTLFGDPSMPLPAEVFTPIKPGNPRFSASVGNKKSSRGWGCTTIRTISEKENHAYMLEFFFLISLLSLFRIIVSRRRRKYKLINPASFKKESSKLESIKKQVSQ